jgi:hypothetical protein
MGSTLGSPFFGFHPDWMHIVSFPYSLLIPYPPLFVPIPCLFLLSCFSSAALHLCFVSRPFTQIFAAQTAAAAI